MGRTHGTCCRVPRHRCTRCTGFGLWVSNLPTADRPEGKPVQCHCCCFACCRLLLLVVVACCCVVGCVVIAKAPPLMPSLSSLPQLPGTRLFLWVNPDIGGARFYRRTFHRQHIICKYCHAYTKSLRVAIYDSKLITMILPFCREALRGDRCYASTRIEFQCQIHVIAEHQQRTVIMMIV